MPGHLCWKDLCRHILTVFWRYYCTASYILLWVRYKDEIGFIVYSALKASNTYSASISRETLQETLQDILLFPSRVVQSTSSARSLCVTNVMTMEPGEASPTNHCIAIRLIIQLSIQRGNGRIYRSTEEIQNVWIIMSVFYFTVYLVYNHSNWSVLCSWGK